MHKIISLRSKTVEVFVLKRSLFDRLNAFLLKRWNQETHRTRRSIKQFFLTWLLLSYSQSTVIPSDTSRQRNVRSIPQSKEPANQIYRSQDTKVFSRDTKTVMELGTPTLPILHSQSIVRYTRPTSLLHGTKTFLPSTVEGLVSRTDERYLLSNNKEKE